MAQDRLDRIHIASVEHLVPWIRPARPASSWWTVALDHVQGVAIGAGGAEHLVPWIRPAWPVSSWRSVSTSITSGDGHRRRRRRAPDAVDPPDGRGIKKRGRKRPLLVSL
ncbi:TPA: hypothetical protein VDV63_006027 [Pseudomonas aeruginosa]|nr:hypothetical protein [Pseudomonas aeruginosa]